MCPDRQLLSVYFDGELPSPWKEKMEAHIAGCPLCGEQLQAYRLISPALAGGETLALEAAQERVWQRLEPRVRPSGSARHSVPGRTLWRRRISIPLPAIAAAMLLFAIVTFLWIRRAPEAAEMSGMTIVSGTEFDMPGIIPVSNIESVLQYLGSRDNSEILILRLPENRNFTGYGEPAIIRAADYSHNSQGWRKP